MAQVTNLINKTTNEVVHPNIEAANIPADAVTTAKVADGAITGAKIASNAVTSGKISSNAVTSGKIAADAVTTAKIADASVTTSKIADNAVTTAKIANEAINYLKLAPHAVGKAKMLLNVYDIGAELQAEAPTTQLDVMHYFEENIINELLAGHEVLLSCFKMGAGSGEKWAFSCMFEYDTNNYEVSFACSQLGSPVVIKCENDSDVATFLTQVQGIFVVTLG